MEKRMDVRKKKLSEKLKNENTKNRISKKKTEIKQNRNRRMKK